MRRFVMTLAPLVALLAAACGGASTSAIDAKVKAAMIAQQGRSDVASRRPSPAAATCTPAGRAPSRSATDCRSSSGLCRCSISESPTRSSCSTRSAERRTFAAPGIDVAKAYASELAVVDGARVKRASCIPASPPAPAGTSPAGPADHVCAARVARQGVERWAVRVVGTGVQLLFRVT